jgi:hypothetical protein
MESSRPLCLRKKGCISNLQYTREDEHWDRQESISKENKTRGAQVLAAMTVS